MAVNYVQSIPKLKGRENYEEWSFAAENLLVLEDMIHCIRPISNKEAKPEEDAKTKESRKQRTVALSSMEAEYMSITEACKEAMYLRSLFCELTGYLCTVLLFNDSQSAQKLVANYVSNRKSKHIDMRYHFIKDAVSNKIINLKYLPSTEMPADVLTKALCPIKHFKCLDGLGLSKIDL